MRAGDQFGGLDDFAPGSSCARPRCSALRASPNTTFQSGDAVVARLGRRLGSDKARPTTTALRQLQLEVAHALAADGAAEPGDRRLADLGAPGDLGIGGVDREGDVGEHHVGDPPLGRTQLAVGILDLRQDVGDAPD